MQRVSPDNSLIFTALCSLTLTIQISLDKICRSHAINNNGSGMSRLQTLESILWVSFASGRSGCDGLVQAPLFITPLLKLALHFALSCHRVRGDRAGQKDPRLMTRKGRQYFFRNLSPLILSHGPGLPITGRWNFLSIESSVNAPIWR